MYNENNKQEQVNNTEKMSKEVKELYSGEKMFTGKKVARLFGGALIFGLVSGVTFQGYQAASGYVTNYLSQSTESGAYGTEESTSVGKNITEQAEAVQQLDNTSTYTASQTSSVSGDVSGVVENVMPSIVAIDTTSTVTTSDWIGRQYQQESSGSGSGIIIGENNSEVLIVTNNHVIEGDNATVKVTFNDNTTADAVVKGADSSSDLAVISVDISTLSDDTKSNIKIATLGNSDNVKVGEMAIAIGNALGYGQSVTVGYISATEREVALEDSTMTLLQTDAAINPGNSGGALLNAAGEVIGINSVKYASEEVEGMGYSIPISDAIPIINDLMNREQLDESEQAYLGIKGQAVTSDAAEQYNMPEGVYIGEVTAGSPAEKAGLKAGQIIVGFKGRSITSMEELADILSYTKAGDTAEIVVNELNNGEYEEKTIEVELGSKADATSANQENSSSEQSSRQSREESNQQQNGSFYRN